MTKPSNNHKDVQVKPILVNTEEQTDPTLTGVASEAEFGFSDRLVGARLVKKGKAAMRKSRSKLSPLGLGSKSPKKSNLSIKEKSKGKLKRSRARESMKHKYASSLSIIS